MKLVIGIMVGFYFQNFWILPYFSPFLFPWGGVVETHLHPIYTGMILLSGLIVICTKVVLEEVKGKR